MRSCALEPSGRYAVKHNPATYYADAADRSSCATDDIPLGNASDGALARDLAAERVPGLPDPGQAVPARED